MGQGDPLGNEIASPCVGICRLDTADVCLGCGRTLGEITQWIRLDEARRRQVVSAAAARLAVRAAQGTEQQA